MIENNTNIANWFNEFSNIKSKSGRIDHIYNLCDWVADGKLIDLELLIKNVNVITFNISELLSFLVIMADMVRQNIITLSFYDAFYIKVEKHISDVDGDRKQDLLKGFEPVNIIKPGIYIKLC